MIKFIQKAIILSELSLASTKLNMHILNMCSTEKQLFKIVEGVDYTKKTLHPTMQKAA